MEGWRTGPQAQKMLNDFPLLFWESEEFCALSGMFQVGRKEFEIRLLCPEGPLNLRGASVLVDSDFEQFLKSDKSIVSKLLNRPGEDVYGFLVEFRELCQTSGKNQPTDPHGRLSTSKLPTASFYRNLLAELESIGWANVESVDESITKVKLSLVDGAKRKHEIDIFLSAEHPYEILKTITQLPTALQNPARSGDKPIASTLRKFNELVEKHQKLFDVLDDFDARTWVVEPEHPTRSETFRKVVIGKFSSLLVDLDAAYPTGVPEFRFFGSETAIGPLRTRLDECLHKWDSALMPVDNLEAILGITFDKPKSGTQAAQFSLECGICYAFRLQDHGIPDIACDYEPCSRPFHRSCLFEWLRSVPDSRQSFDALFGQCPYCSKSISVRGL
uniref:RING-type domain-containing protein n=1 Tax=Rhodosorus marinus TaxID=101924 RepID=A0A7S2ZL15_9RHOD|mmetsp:Transcript_23459/g.93086  ORF Transcript_23459/g.93086 Transcript_23459/m.93086 type:complete len:388 (+) Transcript_23459:418-1581(+)|eukprot:CAMPEP_0113963700 /NCGR_PEP_ID=MMETSP0011_2-20120614/6676_1 /TAXON_ID=101924 /ORGANISM="Rhodosorus marinus" /LENGTH=387 /DNA_ID=CAMNT_0000975813 /DNA_START=254 /DNA_END=1417 /DNA_ORIENTATION=+ /assembly_acc=CAM_ASM_000156